MRAWVYMWVLASHWALALSTRGLDFRHSTTPIVATTFPLPGRTSLCTYAVRCGTQAPHIPHRRRSMRYMMMKEPGVPADEASDVPLSWFDRKLQHAKFGFEQVCGFLI